jgi:hypothetical protein
LGYPDFKGKTITDGFKALGEVAMQMGVLAAHAGASDSARARLENDPALARNRRMIRQLEEEVRDFEAASRKGK